jgi:hypothetical protein
MRRACSLSGYLVLAGCTPGPSEPGGWQVAFAPPPPDLGRSVNPISIRRGRFCPPKYYSPGFSDLPSALPTQSSPSSSNVSTLSISHIYFGMCVAYIAKGGNAIHWTGPLLSLLLHTQGRRNNLCSHCKTIFTENMYNSCESVENMSSYFGLIDGMINKSSWQRDHP